MTNLVPDRECGECIECCRFIAIKTDVLEKPTNVLCPHCAINEGCTVYDRRPSPCSGWYCGWRQMSSLGDHWRPDRSGVVIRMEEDLTFVILDPEQLFQTEEFISFVLHLVRGSVPVRFSMVGPPGRFPAVTPMNERFQKALAPGKTHRAQRELRRFLRFIQGHPWKSDGLTLRTSI